MKTYIVYVKSPTDKIVYDKRFDAKDYNDLQAKVQSFFKYCDKGHEVVRVEEIKRLFGTMEFNFGTNFISAKSC